MRPDTGRLPNYGIQPFGGLCHAIEKGSVFFLHIDLSHFGVYVVRMRREVNDNGFVCYAHRSCPIALPIAPSRSICFSHSDAHAIPLPHSNACNAIFGRSGRLEHPANAGMAMVYSRDE
jgi:hypothetical protein